MRYPILLVALIVLSACTKRDPASSTADDATPAPAPSADTSARVDASLANNPSDNDADAFGTGLGLHGVGEGGGRSEGIGLGNIDSYFADAGPSPVIRAGAVSVNGRLPVAVVQRVVRQQFGRFRLCYDAGRKQTPALAGLITVQLVIGRDGSVQDAKRMSASLPDPLTVQCIVRAFSKIAFPVPEEGIVTVTYPISFAPPPS